MSMAALQMALKTGMQTFLGLTPGVDSADTICDITPGGMPKPNSGQVFYGIVGDDGLIISNDADASLDETYDGIAVIITMRAGYVPGDRTGVELLVANGTNDVDGTGTIGLWPRAEALRAWGHMNYVVMNDANQNASYGIGAGAVGFKQPLKLRSVQGLGTKGPEWFSSEDSDDAITGVAIKLVFGGARRVQKIEQQT